MIHCAFTPQCLILNRFETFDTSSFVGLFPQFTSINFQGLRDLCFCIADAGPEHTGRQAAGYASACQASGANSFCTSAPLAQPSLHSRLDYGFIKLSYICDILTQMGYNKFHLNKQCLLCVINFAFSCPH